MSIKHTDPGNVGCHPSCSRCSFLKEIDQSLSSFVSSLPLAKIGDQNDAYDSLMCVVKDFYELTPRESDVAEQLLQGLSNRSIASNLKISENTVKVHVRKVMGKLNIESRAQVPVIAIKLLRNNNVKKVL